MLSTAEAVCQICSFVCEVGLFRRQNEILLSACCKCGGIVVCLPEIDLIHLLNKIWQGKHMHHQPLQSNFIHSYNLSFDKFIWIHIWLCDACLYSSTSLLLLIFLCPIPICCFYLTTLQTFSSRVPASELNLLTDFPVKGEFILGFWLLVQQSVLRQSLMLFQKEKQTNKTPQMNN